MLPLILLSLGLCLFAFALLRFGFELAKGIFVITFAVIRFVFCWPAEVADRILAKRQNPSELPKAKAIE